MRNIGRIRLLTRSVYGCITRCSGEKLLMRREYQSVDVNSPCVTVGKAAIPSQIPFSSQTETIQMYVSTINGRFRSLTPCFFVIVAICCGGFEAADPALANFYPITTPTLHIIGKNDTIVTEERSRTLIRRCEDYRIEIHEGSKCSWQMAGLPFRIPKHC